MEKFYIFQSQLYELSILAEALPSDGCDMMDDDNETLTTQAPPPDHGKVSTVKPQHETSWGLRSGLT